MDGETLEFCYNTLKRYGCVNSKSQVDTKLFSTVFTHSSYGNETGRPSNERLEFLGDSVVGLITAEHLYDKYSKLDEGEYSKLKSKVVSTEALAEFADRLELTDYLEVASETILRNNPEKLKANLFEAFTAGVYLSCGMEGTRRFVLNFIAPAIAEIVNNNEISDYKSALYELVQKYKEKVSYKELSRTGPDHCPIFIYAVMIGEQVYGVGEGKSKSEAQAVAAEKAYRLYSAGCIREK